MTEIENIGSFPTWDGQRALEARARRAEVEISRWPADWETRFPCDGMCREYAEEDCSRHGRTPAYLWAEIGKLVDRLAAVEALCDNADASIEGVYVRSDRVRAAARGEGAHVDTPLHHLFEAPPASTGPDGCRRCGQPEVSVVHR
jgi:hypothetical protein